MAEKPWVIGAQQNTWVGDYTGTSAAAEKAFDMYVAGSKWGSTWYDGSPTGPILLAPSDSSQFPSTCSSLPLVFGCSNVAC